MTRENRAILNHLVKNVPKGSLLTTAWLKKQGVSSKLAWWYVQSGWLERVASGAYKLAGDTVTWVGILQALQLQLNLPVHLGGKTVLQVLGKAHYLTEDFGQQAIQLFALPNTTLPSWLKSPEIREKFQLFTARLFAFPNSKQQGLFVAKVGGFDIQVATPERAAIEVCYLTPVVISFEEAVLLIEGLSRLRPGILQRLLNACTSIKAKRMLLCLSDHFQHEWLREVNLNLIDLGKGKRVVASGGKYHPKYQLSMPELKEL
jgi:hypothetical protein